VDVESEVLPVAEEEAWDLDLLVSLEDLERLAGCHDAWERDRLEVQERQHRESSRRRSSAWPVWHMADSNNDAAS
jgi:hypothetical protein